MDMGKELLKENEIFKPVDLCDSNGKLLRESAGWSRNPLYNCNLKGKWLRKKKWNYWCIISRDCLFSITISNIDYAGLVFAYFLDFKTMKFIEKTVMVPFGRGCSMPSSVNETVTFKHPQMEAEFISEGYDTHIKTYSDDFNGELLKADFRVIFPEGHETLNVVVPWSDKMFQFTSKQECLPVEGTLAIGNSQYSFTPQDTFACLDYGRGIWPYKVSWNWANASGIANGHVIGFNLGAKWTDGTGITENGIIVDGKVIKLNENVLFEYSKENFMKPWKIKTTVTDRVDLQFIPIYERIANSNFIIFKSEIHQMVGYFSGRIAIDTDEYIEIEGICGCAEDHFGQW